MSDQFEFDKLMKSLTPPPDDEAKRKAKALFLQTAEEKDRAWNETTQENTAKPKRNNFVFHKSRNAWFHFAAGMAAMLILTLGVLTAYDPSFLAGSVRGGGDLLQYRAFPAGAKGHELDTVERVAGELVLLKASDDVIEKSGYLPCRGQTLNAAEYPVLAKIFADGAQTFILPDLSEQSPVTGAVWCIAAN